MDQILEALSQVGAFLRSLGVQAVDIFNILCSEHYGQRMLASLAVVVALVLCMPWFLKFLSYKAKRIITPTRLLCVGVFFAAVVWFMPIYDDIFSELFADETAAGRLLRVHEAALQNAMRLFAVDDGYLELLQSTSSATGEYFIPDNVRGLYAGWGFFLYIFAPILTVGFILTFLKNVTAYLQYTSSFRKKAHVFSELNEHTLAMAKSIDAHYNKNAKGKYKVFGRKAIIVFCDILHKNEEEHLDLLEEAHEMNAVLFRKDITSVIFVRNRMDFYLISEDEEEKLQHALRLMSRYDDKNNALYLFSNTSQSDLLISTKQAEHMTVRRINAIQSLIYDNLEKNGIRLFRNAKDGNICALIVGLGRYGMETLKALVWFCQMQGYFLTVHAFEQDKNAEQTLRLLCPELMEKNGNTKDNDARYQIYIHAGMDANTGEFMEELAKIPDITYTFVGLGTDDVNIAVSTRIRALYSSMQGVGTPDIETIVYDSNVKNTIGYEWTEQGQTSASGGVNHKNQPYRIHMIGDLDSFYSYDTLIATGTELEKAGEEVHSRWNSANAVERKRLPAALQCLKDQKLLHKMCFVKVSLAKDKKDAEKEQFVPTVIEESMFDPEVGVIIDGEDYTARIEQLLCTQYRRLIENCVYGESARRTLLERIEPYLPGNPPQGSDAATHAAYREAAHKGAAVIREQIAPYGLTLCVTEEYLNKNLVLTVVPCGLLETRSLLSKKVVDLESNEYLLRRMLAKWQGTKAERTDTETVKLIVRDAQMQEGPVMVLTLDELIEGVAFPKENIYPALMDLMRKTCPVPFGEKENAENVGGVLWKELRTAPVAEEAKPKKKKKGDAAPRKRAFGIFLDFAAQHSFVAELTDDVCAGARDAEYDAYLEKYHTLEQINAVCAKAALLAVRSDEDKPACQKEILLVTLGEGEQVTACEALNPMLMRQDYYSNRFKNKKLYQRAISLLTDQYPAKKRGEEQGVLARVDWNGLIASERFEYFVLDTARNTLTLEHISDGLEVRLGAMDKPVKDKKQSKSSAAQSSFWKYEYFYRSSVAKAMHERLRVKLYNECLLKNSDFAAAIAAGDWRTRSAEQTHAICYVEHARWNAFMRTEGFRYGVRNDLAKTHNNLVTTEQLSSDDLRKDA